MKEARRIQMLSAAGRVGGFTLLEMVVVVAVLAILATIAVRSLDGVEDQTRFDSTRTQLGNINAAVVGNPQGAGAAGTSPIFSFVSDVGRLPTAYGTDPTTQLQELWANPNNLPPIAVRQATAVDPDVWITGGWRGGYLQLGVGQTSLEDGWGNAYDLFFTNSNGVVTSCDNGDPIEIVRSRGADGQVDTAPTTGFNADQSVVFRSTAAFETMPIANQCYATVTGNVYFYDATTGQVETPNSANGNVFVVLFMPGTDAATNYVATQTASITATANVPFASVTYSFTNVPVGQRVIRAYQYSGSVVPPVGTTPAYRSIPVRLVVQPGAQAQDLTMVSTSSTATTQPSGN